MKRALMAAVLSALVTAAVLATVGFGAATKSSSGKKSSSSGKSAQTQTGPPPTMKEALATEEKERATRQAALAKALGVTTEKLTAAQDAVKKKNLDQAVTDNKLTAAQRDAILACDAAPLTCDRSNLPAYGFGGGFGHHGGPGFGGPGFGGRGFGGRAGTSTYLKDLATELGVTEEKLTTALKAQMPDRGAGDDDGPGHGGHGGRPGFGPPPGMNGASGTTTEQAPATSA